MPKTGLQVQLHLGIICLVCFMVWPIRYKNNGKPGSSGFPNAQTPPFRRVEGGKGRILG